MPVPGGLDDGLEVVVVGLPAQLAPDLLAIGDQDGQVAGAAGRF